MSAARIFSLTTTIIQVLCILQSIRLTLSQSSCRVLNAVTDSPQLLMRLNEDFPQFAAACGGSMLACDSISTVEDFRYYASRTGYTTTPQNYFPYDIWTTDCYFSVRCSVPITSRQTTLLSTFSLPATVLLYSTSAGNNGGPLFPFSTYNIAINRCGLEASDMTTIMLMYKQAANNKTFSINLANNNIGNFSLNMLLYYNDLFTHYFNGAFVTAQRYPSIGVFNLSQNAIQDISADPLEYFASQTYQINNYVELASNIRTRYSIAALDLSFNSISSEVSLRSLCNVDNLQRLYLQGNMLTQLSSLIFDCLPSLITLNLSFNRIFTIAPTAFSATNLQFIDLSNNRLVEVRRTMLPMTLSSLLLHNNRLANVTADLAPVFATTFVTIHGNPIDCCASVWLIDVSSNFMSMTCGQPANVTLSIAANVGCQLPQVTGITLNGTDHIVRCAHNGSSLLFNVTMSVNGQPMTPVNCPVSVTPTNPTVRQQNAIINESCAVIPGSAVMATPGSSNVQFTTSCTVQNYFGRNTSQTILLLPLEEAYQFTADYNKTPRKFSVGELVGAILAVFFLTIILVAILLFIICYRMRVARKQEEKNNQMKMYSSREKHSTPSPIIVLQREDPVTASKVSNQQTARKATIANSNYSLNDKKIPLPPTVDSIKEWEAYAATEDNDGFFDIEEEGDNSWSNLPTLQKRSSDHDDSIVSNGDKRHRSSIHKQIGNKGQITLQIVE